MTLLALDNHEPGPVALTPTKFVWWSGKVAIGLRHEPRYVEQGSHAELIQRLLTTQVPRQWYEHPQTIELKPSLRRRVALLLRGFR